MLTVTNSTVICGRGNHTGMPNLGMPILPCFPRRHRSLRMTHVFRFCRVLLIGLGIAVTLSGAARSEGPPIEFGPGTRSSRAYGTTFGARSGISRPRSTVLNPELSAEASRASIGSEKRRSQPAKSLRTLATGRCCEVATKSGEFITNSLTLCLFGTIRTCRELGIFSGVNLSLFGGPNVFFQIFQSLACICGACCGYRTAGLSSICQRYRAADHR